MRHNGSAEKEETPIARSKSNTNKPLAPKPPPEAQQPLKPVNPPPTTGQPAPAAETAAKRPAIQPTFRDEFDQTQVVEASANGSRSFRDGAYVVESRFPGNGQAAFNFHDYKDGIVEVRARVAKGFFGAWIVNFENFEHKHGIRILVSGDGQLWVLPSMFDRKEEAGPKAVHVKHSAIKPVGEWNTLRLVIKGRTLGVYMNGERVCDEIATSFPIAPGVMAFGNNNDRRNIRVEFDRYVLWPTTDIAQLPAEAKPTAPKVEEKPTETPPRKVKPPANPQLDVPRHISPVDGSVFNVYPRTTTVRWAPVAGAARYKVEVEFWQRQGNRWTTCIPPNRSTELPPDRYSTKECMFLFKFVGAQPGRWRVWAVDEDGNDGPKSNWWTFRYTR